MLCDGTAAWLHPGLHSAVVCAGIELTDNQGWMAVVDILKVGATNVEFSMNGRKGSVKLSDLAGESQRLPSNSQTGRMLRTVSGDGHSVEDCPAPPNHERSRHKRGVNLESSVVISAVRGMDDFPACEATLVIIAQNTRGVCAQQGSVEGLRVADDSDPRRQWSASGAFSSTSC